jgi:DNA-binding MarR family transcriptional regulator
MTPHEQLGRSIKRLQDSHHRRLDAALATLGISLVQWHALREIENHPNSSQLRLAELTFNSAQAFGTLVTRMERSGLIKKKSAGGRAFAISVTPKGSELLQQGRKLVLAELERSFGSLTEKECKSLQTILDKALLAVE